MEKRCSGITFDFSATAAGNRFYGRKIEEYIADFCAVSRRSLDEDDYRIFRYHFLLGADSLLCGRCLRLSQREFFRRVYHIEQLLGRIFRELRPYGLYPLDEYFGGAVRKGPGRAGGEALLGSSVRPRLLRAEPRRTA